MQRTVRHETKIFEKGQSVSYRESVKFRHQFYGEAKTVPPVGGDL